MYWTRPARTARRRIGKPDSDRFLSTKSKSRMKAGTAG
jgi:hypothetical protein